MTRLQRILSAVAFVIATFSALCLLDAHNPLAAMWAGVCAFGSLADLVSGLICDRIRKAAF